MGAAEKSPSTSKVVSDHRFRSSVGSRFHEMTTAGGHRPEQPAGHARDLGFGRIEVCGRSVEQAWGGDGPPVLFLHGWGIGPRSYSDSLHRLVGAGCRVLAPALPGFGGTHALDGDECTFEGYAQWVSRYLDAVGIGAPVVVVGHSFGGGVAVQFAHDHPGRVRAVVACNGVGGGWPGFLERPWWEWGRYLGSDLLSIESLLRVLPAVLGQAVPNIVQNPIAMWRVSDVVRRADLRREVRVLRRRGIGVTVVWSDRDRLVSHGGFSSMCTAAGVQGVVVPGNHSWLIADPARFVDVILGALVEVGVVEESLVRLTA